MSVIKKIQNSIPISMALLLFMISSTSAISADAPLFDAFKRFCIDTNMEATSIQTALEISGGSQQQPSPIDPRPTPVRPWTVTVDGRKILVTFETTTDPGNGRRVRATINDSCSASILSVDNASVLAIRNWMGIPPKNHSDIVDYYDYYLNNSAHKPTPALADDAYYAFLTVHPIYLLTAPSKPGNFLTLSLMRTRLPSEK